MAGSTTNLGLTKPTYSEDADIAVINTNMDTLDSKIGAVGSTSLQAQITSANEAIANLNISAISSSTTIASLCNSCPAREHRYYFIADSNTLTDYPSTTRMYRVLLSIHKIDGTNNRADIDIIGKTGSDIPMEYIGVYENGTVYWSQLALKSDLTNIDTTTFTLASGYTANINSVSKNNKIVTIEGEVNFASTTSTSFTAIVTIPSGYRPTSNFVVSAIDPINDGILAGTLLSSTGNLSFYRSYSTPTTQIRFSATYITN